MPRFPTYERNQGLGGGPTASYASAGAFQGPARALQQAGGQLADLGQAIDANVQKIQNSQDDVWLSKARAETVLEMQKRQNDAQLAATDGANGYTDGIRQTFSEVQQSFLDRAPSDRARLMYQEWSNSYSATPIGEAASFQARSVLAKRDSDFADTMLAHGQAVLADPSQYDAVHKRAMDDLQGAKQWMTPEQEQKARQAVERNLQIARAKGEIQRDPKAFMNEIGLGGAQETGPIAVDNVVAKIVGAESGGNANAKNPNSTAEGAGQFIDSTWLTMIRKYRPDIAAGKSDSQIIALKTDKALSVEMTKHYTQENAQALTAAGHEANAGNLYLAHFLGPGGAKMTLDHGDGVALESFLSPAVIKANPFLRGKTVGWIREWAANKMGGAASPNVVGNSRFSALDTQDILGLQQEAQSQLNSLLKQQAANQNEQLAAMKGAFQLGIATGDPGVTQSAIMQSPLADGDKAALINSLNSAQKTNRMAQDAASRLNNGGAFNPYDENDRKGINALYDAAVGNASLWGDGNAQGVLDYVYGKTGIVPKTASNQIRAGLLSQDPKVVGAAASIASSLAYTDRGKLGANENGSDLQKAATTYQHLTDTLGLTSAEAGQRMMDMRDPEKQRQRQALLETKAVKDAIKNIGAADVRNVWDTFGPNALTGYDVGETDLAQAAMVADYRDIFSESIVEANGDQELAKKMTADRFKRIYGPSDLTLAHGTITKYPPENAYPPAPDGTHDYIRDQAIQALKDEGVDTSKVYLQAYDGTEQDIHSGHPPRYQLYYEQDGRMQQYNLPFFAIPDFSAQPVDMSGNVSRMENNRALEIERQKMLATGKPSMSALQEMTKSARDATALINKDTQKAAPVPSGNGGGGF